MPRAIVVAAALGFVALTVEAQECVWTQALRETTKPAERSGFVDFSAGAAPGGLAADPNGLLYASYPELGIVDVRDPSGDVVSIRAAFERPFAIALDPSGRAYVGEQRAGRVGVFEPGWELQFYLGEGDGEFVNPTGIAVDPGGAGWIYVVDGGAHEVRVYASDGTFLFTFGGRGSGPGLFDFPAAIHLVPGQGGNPTRLYVSDQNNDRVQILDELGTFVSCIGGSSDGQRFGRVTGLATDPVGRLFVADAFQGHVWLFDADGALLDTVGEFGSARGQLMTPLGLAIRGGSLYVASFNTRRVEVFGLPVNATSLMTIRRARKKP